MEITVWTAPASLLPSLPEDDTTTATARQLAAIETLGIVGVAYTLRQAGLLLAARDYADRIMLDAKLPGWHYKEARLVLIGAVLAHVDRHEWLIKWSRRERDRGDVGEGRKRIPRDELRADVEAKAAAIAKERSSA